MPAVGQLFGTQYGFDDYARSVHVSGPTNVAMQTINNGVAFRFMAPDTRDVKSVYIQWASIASAGTVTVSIQTINAATGKPSGSLYDANATKTFTPVAGWQNVQFASLPTTGLTAGAEYAIVVVTASTGTTHSLRAYVTGSYSNPAITLQTTDGSTFTETANAIPIATIVFEDDA